MENSINRPGELPHEKSAFYFQRAKRLFADGSRSSIELERVIRDITRASTFVPNEKNHYLFMAKVYKYAQDIASAMSCLRTAIKLDPNHSGAKKQLYELLVKFGQELMCMAVELENEKRYFTSAKRFFEEALQIEHYESRVWCFHAVCCIHLAQHQVALESLNRAIHASITKVNVELFVMRAKVYWAIGLIDQGNRDIRVAASRDSQHPEVLAYTTKSYIKADKLYTQSKDFFAQGNFDEALKHVTYALTICSDDIKLLLMTCKIHRAMGNLQAAYGSVQKAAKLFQSSSEFAENMALPSDITKQSNLIFNEMALQFASKGDYERSIVLLNKAIQSEREFNHDLMDVDFRYYMNRGDCYRALNRLALAISDYEMAQSLCPTDWTIRTKLSMTHYLIAAELFNTGDFRSTERELSQAIIQNPKVSEYYSVRGKARYYLADFKGAFNDFKKCIEIDPNNKDIAERLQQFEQHGGLDSDEQSFLQQDDTAVLSNTTSTQDVLKLILNPKAARKLPSISLKSSALQDISDMKKSSSHWESSQVYLPKISPNMTAPLMASIATKEVNVEVKKVIDARVDVKKDHLWKLMTNAKTLAKSKEKKSEVEKRVIAVSAAGLKRLSEKNRKKGIDSRLIAGVVATSHIPRSVAIKKFESSAAKSSQEVDLSQIKSSHHRKEEEEEIPPEISNKPVDEDLIKRLIRRDEEDEEEVVTTTNDVKDDDSIKKKTKKHRSRSKRTRSFASRSRTDSSGRVVLCSSNSIDSDSEFDSDMDDDIEDESRIVNLLNQTGVESAFVLPTFDDETTSSLLLSDEEELILLQKQAQKQN